jgi:hypothetical protein
MTLPQWIPNFFTCCTLALSLSACDAKDKLAQLKSLAPRTAVNKPASSSSLALTKEYKCNYEKRFKDGESIGAKVELGIAQGKINKLVVYSSIASGEEGGGYLCGIDTSDKEQTVKWSTLNNKTILNISESIIEIEPIGRGYKINLEDASREGCGFGAEWPEYVVIEPGNSKCQIKN